MSDDTTFDITGLNKLLAALKGKPPTARIGIAATPHQGKNGSKISNAQLGAVHEFGTSSIPQRSFLRVPLMEQLGKKLEQSTLLDTDMLAQVIATKTVVPWVEGILKVAKEVVDGAFTSGGYGKWPAWKNPSYKNQTGQLLRDTDQLREAIVTEVRK